MNSASNFRAATTTDPVVQNSRRFVMNRRPLYRFLFRTQDFISPDGSFPSFSLPEIPVQTPCEEQAERESDQADSAEDDRRSRHVVSREGGRRMAPGLVLPFLFLFQPDLQYRYVGGIDPRDASGGPQAHRLLLCQLLSCLKPQMRNLLIRDIRA